ncbi:MAG: hypothetical protein H6733_07020 [Alphaproteobacteria bacterium]|nr:hypothetical protein [Alphaproteobacteria bacterium]
MTHPTRALAVLGLIGVTACTSADDADPVDTDTDTTPVAYADPGAPGPYPVGLRTITLPDVAGYADVPVEVWYPAVASTGGPKGAYTFLGVDFPAEAWRDALPDPTAPRQLVAFSHGLGGVRQQNYTMCERLASFGFIVVAPEHPGTTTLEYLSSFGNLGPALVRRPFTVRAAVDAVIDGAIDGLVPADPDHYAVIGHSLGALTAMAVAGGRMSGPGYEAACGADDPPKACRLIGPLTYDAADVDTYATPDDRVVATILQSPGGLYGFEDGTLAALPEPLVLGATLDTVLDYEDETVPVFDALAAPTAMATFEGAGHYGYTNMCDLSVASLFAPDCDGADAGFVDPLDVRAKANRLVVAWIGATLGQNAAFEDDLVALEGVDWQTR